MEYCPLPDSSSFLYGKSSSTKFNLLLMHLTIIIMVIITTLLTITINIVDGSLQSSRTSSSPGKNNGEIMTTMLTKDESNLNMSKLLKKSNYDDDNKSSSSSGIIIYNHKKKPPLRQRFEFVSNFKPVHIDESNVDSYDNITHILMPHNLQYKHHPHFRRTPTTFRPSSSILYLHPPKPHHIESIQSVLTTLNLTSTQIIVGWKVIVRLRNASMSRTRRKVEAKVEEEENPLHYNLYLRRYGFPQRIRYKIFDQNNTLDPPITKNQSYHYQMDQLEHMNAYEFCLQSVNGGSIHETDEIRRQYPVNAQTELAGRNNPMFLCKELVMPPPTSFSPSQASEPSIEPKMMNDRTTGRSQNYQTSDGGRSNGNSIIEVSEDATDAFVLYTAITSGSTTLLILVIISIFCCCRCRRKIQKENYHRTLVYDRVGLPPPTIHGDDNTTNIIAPYYGYRI